MRRWLALVTLYVAQVLWLYGGPAVINGFAALDRWQHKT